MMRGMAMAALVITVLGLAISLAGAGWLLVKIRPDDPRYVDDGMLFPGPQHSVVLPRFIRDQQRPSIVVVIGGGLQVLGGVLAIWASV